MKTNLLACLIVLAGATLAHADVWQSGKTIRLSTPNAAWEIRAPRGTWQMKEERRREDGLAFYYLFSDPKTKINASFYIEPADKCTTSVDCRTLFWSNPEPIYQNPEAVKLFEENGFAVVQFVIPRIGGKPVTQLNYSAHLVRDGFWIEVHLSKLHSQTGDAAVFSDFIKSISLQRKSAASDPEMQREERTYPIADRGSLRMSVPTSWHEIIRQPSEQVPATIIYRQAAGSPFEILVTPSWDPTHSAEAPMIEAIHQRVQEMAAALADLTVERRFNIVELTGASGRGYYFSATDKAPKPGGFICLTQGILSVGELAVTFTVRTNSLTDQALKDALAMLKDAVLVK